MVHCEGISRTQFALSGPLYISWPDHRFNAHIPQRAMKTAEQPYDTLLQVQVHTGYQMLMLRLSLKPTLALVVAMRQGCSHLCLGCKFDDTICCSQLCGYMLCNIPELQLPYHSGTLLKLGNVVPRWITQCHECRTIRRLLGDVYPASFGHHAL